MAFTQRVATKLVELSWPCMCEVGRKCDGCQLMADYNKVQARQLYLTEGRHGAVLYIVGRRAAGPISRATMFEVGRDRDLYRPHPYNHECHGAGCIQADARLLEQGSDANGSYGRC